MDVTVCVPTFGDEKWIDLAGRAMTSAKAQGVVACHAHGDTLAGARSAALHVVMTEWVIFLDADDELAPGYVEAMGEAQADLRVPLVQYVRANGRRFPPHMPKVAGHQHTCDSTCLAEGNWMVIGTALRTELARQIGWREYPVYEDWDFFQRCWLAGASVQAVPGAVYVAHVRPDSRNRARSMAFKNAIHQRIVTTNLGS